MAYIIRLQNLPWSAKAADIRQFFHGLNIPGGGVHIVGGEDGDAFIAFATDEDARQALLKDNQTINHVGVRLQLSSKSEMKKVVLASRVSLDLQNKSNNITTASSAASAADVADDIVKSHIPETPASPVGENNFSYTSPPPVTIYDNAISNERQTAAAAHAHARHSFHNNNKSDNEEEFIPYLGNHNNLSMPPPPTAHTQFADDNFNHLGYSVFDPSSCVTMETPTPSSLSYYSNNGNDYYSTQDEYYYPPHPPPPHQKPIESSYHSRPPHYPQQQQPPPINLATQQQQSSIVNRERFPHPPGHQQLSALQKLFPTKPNQMQPEKSQHNAPPSRYGYHSQPPGGHHQTIQHPSTRTTGGGGPPTSFNQSRSSRLAPSAAAVRQPINPMRPNFPPSNANRSAAPPNKRLRVEPLSQSRVNPSLLSPPPPTTTSGNAVAAATNLNSTSSYIRLVCHPDDLKPNYIFHLLPNIHVTPQTGIRIETDEAGRITGNAYIELLDKESLHYALNFPPVSVKGVDCFIKKSNREEFLSIPTASELAAFRRATTAATISSSQRKLPPVQNPQPYMDDCMVEIQQLPLTATVDRLIHFLKIDSQSTLYLGKVHNTYSQIMKAFVKCHNLAALQLVKQKDGLPYSVNSSVCKLRIVQTSVQRFQAFAFMCSPQSGGQLTSANGHEQHFVNHSIANGKATPTNVSQCSLKNNNNSSHSSTPPAPTPSLTATTATAASPSTTTATPLPTAVSTDPLPTCIQVNNVPKSVNVRDILNLFQMQDLVEEETVVRDFVNSRMFIEFATAQDCAKAAGVCKSKMCRGACVRLLLLTKEQMQELLPNQANRTNQQTIVIKNLPMNASVEQIREVFTDYDIIPQSISLKLSTLGKPLGEATLVVKTVAEAERAMGNLKYFSGRRILLDFV